MDVMALLKSLELGRSQRIVGAEKICGQMRNAHREATITAQQQIIKFRMTEYCQNVSASTRSEIVRVNEETRRAASPLAGI
jgi:hypothetical protein